MIKTRPTMTKIRPTMTKIRPTMINIQPAMIRTDTTTPKIPTPKKRKTIMEKIRPVFYSVVAGYGSLKMMQLCTIVNSLMVFYFNIRLNFVL